MLVDKNYGVFFRRVSNSLSHTNSEKEKVWFVHHYERLVTWLKTSSCKVVAGNPARLLCPGSLSWRRSSHAKRQRRLQRQKMLTPANPASYTSYKVATLCCQNLPIVNQKISNSSVTLEVTRNHFEMPLGIRWGVNFFSACVDNL